MPCKLQTCWPLSPSPDFDLFLKSQMPSRVGKCPHTRALRMNTGTMHVHTGTAGSGLGPTSGRKAKIDFLEAKIDNSYGLGGSNALWECLLPHV
jgi:hypothetical protein